MGISDFIAGASGVAGTVLGSALGGPIGGAVGGTAGGIIGDAIGGSSNGAPSAPSAPDSYPAGGALRRGLLAIIRLSQHPARSPYSPQHNQWRQSMTVLGQVVRRIAQQKQASQRTSAPLAPGVADALSSPDEQSQQSGAQTRQPTRDEIRREYARRRRADQTDGPRRHRQGAPESAAARTAYERAYERAKRAHRRQDERVTSPGGTTDFSRFY